MIVRARVGVMLAVLAGGMLAGCLGDEDPTAGAPLTTATDVATSALAPGFYMFRHAGGPLLFRLADGESVAFTLFDGGDQRVGRVEFVRDGFADRVELADAAPGDYVAWVDSINGTLAVDSGGQPVTTVAALGWHVERHVLAEAPIDDDPLREIFALTPAGDAIHKAVSGTFLRPPTALRLLALGEGEAVQVRVTGRAGTMLTVSDAFYSTRGSNAFQLEALEAPFDAARAAAAFTADVSANAFSGVLLIEAYSYSRLVRAQVPSGPALAAPAFVYGDLPSDPVAAQVARDATAIFLSAPAAEPCEEDCSGFFAAGLAAVVSVFDRDDRPVGVFHVWPNQTVAVPVTGGGDFVFVARGAVSLGADVVPSDFSLRVLEVAETMLLSSGIGAWDDYEQAWLEQSVSGVAYAIAADRTPPSQSSEILDPLDPIASLFGPPCSLAGATRLVAGNETVGFWADNLASDWGGGVGQALVLLPAHGAISFVQDGMGDECGQVTGRVLSYLR